MNIRIKTLVLLTAVLCTTACAQTPRLKPDSNIDDILDALDNSGKSLHSFSANVKRQEFDDVTGGEIDRTGSICFEIQNDGNAIFHLIFDHKQVQKTVSNEKVEYQIQDGWLTVLDWKKKNEVRRQLNQPAHKTDLFQLGQGQFPLPIGQDKKTVHAQFDVAKVAPDKDDPANTVHLKLTPRPGTQFANTYSLFEVWVDLSTNMPVRVATTNAQKTQDTVNDLLNLQINPKLSKEDLSVPPLDKTWNYNETALK